MSWGEAADVAQSGAEVAADCGGILIPALAVVIVVTEVLSVLDAAEINAELQASLKHVRAALRQRRVSIASVKKAITSLLKAGIAAISDCDRLPPKIEQTKGNAAYDRQFETRVLQSMIDEVHGISPNTAASRNGLKTSAHAEVSEALGFIRDHAVNDSQMTEVIAMIRKRAAAEGADNVDADYLENVATLLDIDSARVHRLERFRKVLNDTSASLAPFHLQINNGLGRRTGLGKPKFGNMDPRRQPRPDQFKNPLVMAR